MRTQLGLVFDASKLSLCLNSWVLLVEVVLEATVVNTLVEAFEGSVSTVAFDSYYRDQGHMTLNERALVNYDHPDSLDVELFVNHWALRDGKTIDTPFTICRLIRKP